MAKKTPYIPTMIDTVLLFTAAAAAQRINGCYVKSQDHEHRDKRSNRDIMLKLAGLQILIDTPAEWAIEDIDHEQAKLIMDYYKSKTLDIMSGKANAYTMAAANAAFKEQIASNDNLTIGTIASLPQAYSRSVAYDNTWDCVENLKRNSKHFGNVGDKFEGQIEVLSCIYSKNWFKYYVTALTSAGNVVNFASDKEFGQGEKVDITTAKIKQHANENITRLHYVRVKRDNSVDTSVE